MTSEGSPCFDIVSFSQWWNSGSDNPHGVLPLVDIRLNEEYEKRRLESQLVTIVHLPLEFLLTGERSGELPPRHVKFAILTSNETMEQAEQFFFATHSKATQQSRQPWRVQCALLASSSLWNAATKVGLYREGLSNNAIQDNGRFQPLPRLWRPDPMIEHVLLPLLVSSPREHGEVWDLGSGAGRDVCFLAEHLLKESQKTFHIVGIDVHKGSSQKSIPFWKRRGVPHVASTRLWDLNKVDLMEQEIQHSNVVCLYAVRFLNRKLVHMIANCDHIERDTIFAMSQFCKPTEGASWDFDHPMEKHVLERNELQTTFEQASCNWEILHNEIASDGDHGRTLIHFVAQRVKESP